MRARHFPIGCAVAFCAGIMPSCASDDGAAADPVNPQAIRFNAVSNRISRGIVTTTANIQEFCVTAFTGNKMLMDNVHVTREGSEWTYSPSAYWPETPVNFFALSPDISDAPVFEGGSSGTANLRGYKNPGNIDLLYAVNMGEIQSGAPVNINFRHALAKVNVFLSSSNSAFIVKINKVVIGNVCTEGSFFFPRATTSPGGDAVGKWFNQTSMTDIKVYSAGAGANVVLTPDPTDLGGANPAESLDFFIPQVLGRLSYDDANNVLTGSYISVDCQIFDRATGAKLFPGSHTPSYLLVPETGCGRILYPTTNSSVSQWRQGYSYIYNIAINDPAVLLDGIGFGVTVDEYTDQVINENPSI